MNLLTANSYLCSYGTAKNVLSNPVAAIGGNLHIDTMYTLQLLHLIRISRQVAIMTLFQSALYTPLK
jgi:hypothetical protein